MNKSTIYHNFLVIVVAILCFALTPSIGYSTPSQGEDDATFHFVGDNRIGHGGGISCYYDLELGCHLESNLYGYRRYSINWISFKIDLYYTYSPNTYPAPEGTPPISEHYVIVFDSEDFDLSFETSEVRFVPEGAPVSPIEADWYNVFVQLKQDKIFHTPKKSQIIYRRPYPQSHDLLFGTLDAADNYVEWGIFGMAVLILPSPYSQEPVIYFGELNLQDTPASIRFLDAEVPSREVVGASADGKSEVIIEVTRALEEPEVTIPEGGGEWVEDDYWRQVDDGVWHRTWKAPKEFGQDEKYKKSDSRIIDFEFNIDGKTIEGSPFFLYKPPVLLLHGIFSDGDIWGGKTGGKMKQTLLNEYLGGNEFLIYDPNYTNDAHFDSNVHEIRDCVNQCIQLAKHLAIFDSYDDIENQIKNQIVVKQVDIVAHSMGGILANLYVASDLYNEDVNRIITIETPHSGSEWANFLLHFICEEMNDRQRWVFWNVQHRFFSWQFKGSIKGGAVEDLQVGSEAINNYREMLASSNRDVGVYAIQGVHKLHEPSFRIHLMYDDDFCMGFWYWDHVLNTEMPLFSGEEYDPVEVEAGLFPQGKFSSDFVVSLESQRGGSTRAIPLQIIDHISTVDDDSIIAKVCELLNAPLSTFGPEFSPPDDYPSARVGTVQDTVLYRCFGNISANEEISGLENNFKSGKNGGIRITYPPEGSIFFPEDTLTLSVSYNGDSIYGISFVAECGVSGFDDTEPYEFKFLVSEEYIGSMLIAVVAVTDVFPESDSLWDDVVVSVVPTDAPEEIDIIPSGFVYLYIGGTCILHAAGIYQDGVRRDVTSSAAGTFYSSSDPSIAQVSQDGIINAESPGISRIAVQNGAVGELQVIVLGNPGQVSNPDPPDGTTDVSPSTNLDWWGVEDASTYDLYLWETSDSKPTTPTVAGLTKSFYDPPSELESGITYYWQVVAKNYSGQTEGPVWSFVTTGVTSKEAQIRVSPNPFAPSRGHTEISFFGAGLPFTKIKIFNKAGELVRTLEEYEGNNRLDWDATSDDGKKLASGVYIWISTNQTGKHEKGKFAIIR